MPDTLPVHVNRESLHSLEVPTSFETDGSFDVRLINHGEPIHVHLHLDDSLSELAAIEAPNHHVDRESERPVRVTVTRPAPVRGSLKVATSYGAETRYIDVNLVEPSESEESVQVDESLGKPQGPPESTSDSGPASAAGLDRLSGPVVGLAVVAVVLAILVAAMLGGLVAWAGAFVVALAVVAALVLLLSE